MAIIYGLIFTNARFHLDNVLPADQVTVLEESALENDTKLAEVERIVTGIETQIATLTAYRKSLIHECVTGQRRVTEADVRRAGAVGGWPPAQPLAAGKKL